MPEVVKEVLDHIFKEGSAGGLVIPGLDLAVKDELPTVKELPNGLQVQIQLQNRLYNTFLSSRQLMTDEELRSLLSRYQQTFPRMCTYGQCER